MKKLLLILPLLALFNSTESKAHGWDPEWYELVSLSTAFPFMVTTEQFNREEVQKLIADDLAKYDLSGEITPSLEMYLEDAMDKKMTESEAIAHLESLL